MVEEKKHRIIVKYKLYGDHVRTRFFMGPLDEETAANLGSLIFRLDEFEALREILQQGLKEYRNAELEFREVDNIGGMKDEARSS
jgi:hypothetical protein